MTMTTNINRKKKMHVLECTDTNHVHSHTHSPLDKEQYISSLIQKCTSKYVKCLNFESKCFLHTYKVIHSTQKSGTVNIRYVSEQ